jgi:CRISPR-associated protein Cas2
MALNQIRNWLVAYDIANPRRLRRVHRFLCRHAVPVQYSVFVARCSPAKLGVIRASLADLVKKREDDVRFYPVPEPAQLFVYGRKALPEGLLVLEGGGSLTLGPTVPLSSGKQSRTAIGLRPGEEIHVLSGSRVQDLAAPVVDDCKCPCF